MTTETQAKTKMATSTTTAASGSSEGGKDASSGRGGGGGGRGGRSGRGGRGRGSGRAGGGRAGGGGRNSTNQNDNKGGRGGGRGGGGRGGGGQGGREQNKQEQGRGQNHDRQPSAQDQEGGKNSEQQQQRQNQSSDARAEGGRGGRGRGRGRGRGEQGKKQQQQNDQSSDQRDDGLVTGTENINSEGKQKQQNKPKGKDKDNQGGTQQQQQKKSEKTKQTNKNNASTQQEQQQQQQQKKNEKTKQQKKNNATTQQEEFSLAPSIPPSQPQQTSDINYGKGQNIVILHVAEKPSIAQAIANGLCSGGSPDYRSKSLPVHEFTGPSFPKAPHAKKCNHKVTSVAGHVFSVDFGSEYQSWDAVDPAELFQAPVLRKPTKGSIVKHLQDEARGVDFIVLWLDCDREGENINFEVLDCCMHLMKSGGSDTNYARVYRAHFSAINPSDIVKAYQNLGKPDKNQALAVDARQELDLKVGVAFSRFQTRYFQGRYGDLDSSVLSYGPCQTPTLGFCVQRRIDIETFKAEPYWVLELGIVKRGRRMRALWDAGRSFNRNKVETLQTKALSEGPSVAVVKNVVTKEKKQGRPVPLNTVALLKACSKALGIGPHAAMQNAERLYLSGYLSYPRTESSAYPKSFDIDGTLRQQASDNRWGKFVSNLLREGHTKSRGGVDMGDHPPITPCRSARPHELSGDMARVYDFVVRHFIASVSPDAVWKSTRVDFAVECLGDQSGTFTLRGKQIVSEGFLAVLLHKEYGEEANKDDDDEDEEDREIPEFSVGELIPLVNSASSTNSSSAKVAVAHGQAVHGTLDMKEKMTTPPSFLTESELIGMMEKHGIGTDASIPTHIENIQKRNYVTLESGRQLHPAKLGMVLVQGYHRIDSTLVLPQVRSDIEDQCNKIAKGQASRDEVVKRALELFKNKFDFFVENVGKMDVLFSSSFSKLEDVGKPFTRCGLTRRYLQYIPGPPQRLYNKWTEMVYPLPLGGMVKQWTGRTCTVEGCNFELCMYSVGQPQRSFPLCPRCFNDPEWAMDAADLPEDPVDREDEGKERKIQRIAGKALTLECPLPDQHPLIDELTVSPDPDSDGVLILDPHFGPKWRLVSTRDPTIIHLPQSIAKVTILDRKDDILGVHLMQIEFKENESPLPDKSSKYTCCFANDELLQGLVRVHHGSDRLKAAPRRGGGRGGGGRGRGRGGRRGSR